MKTVAFGAQVMDPIIIQDRTLAEIIRLASCQDEIGVRPPQDRSFRLAERGSGKHQIVSGHFELWKYCFPMTLVDGVIG